MDSSGTKEFIDRVVTRYSSMLLHLASSRLRSPDDAEDAVQEVYMKLLTAAPEFRDEEHEKAWLIRATINAACDARRRENVRDHLSLDDCQLEAPEPGGNTPLLSAVRALPDKYGAVIHLFYYEGYTLKEIAKILALPAPTVGTRLNRGRRLLKEMLKEEEP